MKIGMVSDSLAHLGLEEMLDAAVGLGIAGIEVNTGNWSAAPHLDLKEMLESKIVVGMRSKKHWLNVVPAVQNVPFVKNPQNPHISPANIATMRGPFRFIQSPPSIDVHPRQKKLSVKVNETCAMLQPNSLTSGMRNTLQAYAAPSAICRQTPATAIHHRFAERMLAPKMARSRPPCQAARAPPARFRQSGD